VLDVLGRDIAPDRMRVETQARNTYENAALSKATAHPSSGEPRAIATFHRRGFAVDPWPIYDLDAYRPRPVRGPPQMVGPRCLLAARPHKQFATLVDH
jgi:hypothetical protein